MSRAIRGFALAFLAIGATSARSGDEPKPGPGPGASVDHILAEWHAKASAIKSVEATFRQVDPSKRWGSSRGEGRLILAEPNLALVEFSKDDEAEKSSSIAQRLVWDGKSLLHFDMDRREATRYAFKEERPAPALLRLPFLFQMSVEEARRDYAWEVLLEDLDRIVLKVIPRTPTPKWMGFSLCTIELDRKTFLPRSMIALKPDGTGRQVYRAIAVKLDEVKDSGELIDPCLDAWTVTQVPAWLTRLFLK